MWLMTLDHVFHLFRIKLAYYIMQSQQGLAYWVWNFFKEHINSCRTIMETYDEDSYAPY